jgi:VWFA-related protein
MIRRLALFALCIAATVPQARPEDSLTRVLVTAPEGVTVAGLTPSDVLVEQDGRNGGASPESVQYPAPLRMGVVLDESGSGRRSPLHAFLTGRVLDWATVTLARYGGDAFLVGFNDQIIISTEIVPDALQLRGALTQLRPIGGSAVRNAIIHAAQKFYSLGPEPKPSARLIVLVSDGYDNASFLGERKAVEYAQREGVRVYAISDPSPEAAAGKEFLQLLCEQTGGKAFFPRDESGLNTVLHALERDLADSFLIAFVPRTRDGKAHRLRVKLQKTPTADLRFMPNFYAPAER